MLPSEGVVEGKEDVGCCKVEEESEGWREEESLGEVGVSVRVGVGCGERGSPSEDLNFRRALSD